MSAIPLKSRKIISIQRPGMWLLSALVLVLLIALSIWLAYEYGRNVAGFDRAESEKVTDGLHQQISKMHQKNGEIQQQNAMLVRNSRIDGDAGEHIKSTFGEAQIEVQNLKKELEFYKSIISPVASKRSLALQVVELQKQEGRRYRYKITVSQKGRNDRAAKGTLDVSIVGKKQGQPVTLNLSEVMTEKKLLNKFNFKYFQNFEGTMNMPEEFWPEYLQVNVKPKSKVIKALDEQFAWSDLTAGGS